MLVERKIPLELSVDSNKIVDIKQKRQLVAKVMFKNNTFQKKKKQLDFVDSFKYLQDNNWDIDLTKT